MQQSEEILKIKTEFTVYKEATDQKFDEILDKLKPQFSKNQITAFLFSAVGIMASVFIWVGTLQADIANLKKHPEDTSLHMPFRDRIEVFVPRVELDSRLKNIEDLLDKIEKKID